MYKKKMLFGMSILIAAAMILGACAPVATQVQATPVATESIAPSATQASNSPAEPAKPEKLTFWMQKTFVDEGNAEIEAHVKEFTEKTGIPVDLRMISVDDLPTQWSAAIESNDVPDVSYFGYEDLGRFYNQGVILDISDTVNDIETKYGKLTPELLKSVTIDGKYWGVPMWAEPTVLYYRKDLFQKAGIAAPPDTWDEFLQDAKKLTDSANGIYGAGYGIGKDDSDSEWWFRDLIWSNGGSLNAEDGKTATVNTPEVKATFQWIKDFFTTDKVTPPGVVGWDDGGNNTAWLSGQVAMVMNTGSIYNKIMTTPDYPDLKDNTGIALVPQGPKGRYITGISNVLGIFKGSKNPYWAKQLIIWMMDKEWQRTWMKSGNYLIIPAYPELAEDPFWQTEVGKVFAATPQYFAFLGYPGSYTPGSGEVANSRMLTDALEKVIVQNQPIDDVLKQFEVDLNATLNK